MHDLVVKGGKLITPRGVETGDVGIDDGRIAAIAPELEGRRRLDASDLLVLPGAVDPHVHLEMPSPPTESSDNWDTGPLAAAFGGTTTIISFVEPAPDESMLDGLARRRAAAEGRASIDFSFHMTVTSAEVEELNGLDQCMQAGLTSFKMYTTYAGFGMQADEMRTAMRAMSKLQALPIVHAEEDEIIQQETRRWLAEAPADPASHGRSRPPRAEGTAVENVLHLAEQAESAVYFVHISTEAGAAAIENARAGGQLAFGETCPQYLLLTNLEYERPDFEGAKFVCSPPLRDSDQPPPLWQALQSGDLQVVATDHCPFMFEGQKDLGRERFDRIPAGLPGVEMRLRLMYSFGVAAGRLELADWVRVCCTEPARLFGLYPAKGALTPGADADLVLFDPEAQETVTHTMLHEHVDYSPYEGLNVKGQVHSVIKSGELLIDQGHLVGRRGGGRFLRRSVSLGIAAHG